MTDTKARERFAYLQSTARQAAENARSYAIDLRVKYGDRYYRGTCGRKENGRLEQLQRTETKAVDKFFAFLDTIATRQFRSGVPCHWIIEQLTYDDATAQGALSSVPPPAYGSTAYDMAYFASDRYPRINQVVQS